MAGTHSPVPPSAAPRTAAPGFNASPRVPWLAGPHGDVLTGLRSAVFDGAGALVLTGDAGAGKTTVARTLAELMRAQGMAIARLERPAQSADEFLQTVGETYGWPDIRPDTIRATAERYLAEAHARGERALLIVDDAHRLGRDVLAEVALLVRFARQHGAGQRPPLTVLLVGHDKLLAVLDSQENAVLESLIDGRYRLRPLTEDEVQRYIERLVGADSPPHVFTRPAMQKIADVSRGIPRDIDALCEAALNDASRRRARLVGTKLVPASAAAVKATRQAAQSVKSVVKAQGRRRPPKIPRAYRNTVLVGVGLLVLIGLPAAYVVRQIRPQPAAARMRPAIAPPSAPATVMAPVEPTRLEPPTPAPAAVQESALPVPETLPTLPAPSPAPRLETLPTVPVPPPAPRAEPVPTRPVPPPAPRGETLPTRPFPTSAPRPTIAATAPSAAVPPANAPPPVVIPPVVIPPVARPSVPAPSVATPPMAAPALRDRPLPRAEPPAPVVSRPTASSERPVPPQRPERPASQRPEPDPSAVMDWLFRDAPRASD